MPQEKRQRVGAPRNELHRRRGDHEVDAERTQLIPHPLKSVGLQASNRLSGRSRDSVRDMKPYSTCSTCKSKSTVFAMYQILFQFENM